MKFLVILLVLFVGQNTLAADAKTKAKKSARKPAQMATTSECVGAAGKQNGALAASTTAALTEVMDDQDIELTGTVTFEGRPQTAVTLKIDKALVIPVGAESGGKIVSRTLLSGKIRVDDDGKKFIMSCDNIIAGN